jgi:hypothetical protein
MNQPILINIDEHGLIRITFSGDLLEADLPFFKSGLEIGRNIIREFFEKSGRKARIILDMNKFTGQYTVEALEALTGFAKQNRAYVEKTASFGGSDKVKAAGEVVTALAERENIRIFATEKEALAWLKE